MNVVTLCNDRLVARWVTVFAQVNHLSAEPGIQAYSARACSLCWLEWVPGESWGSKQAYRVTHQPVSVVWQCSLIAWLNGLASGDQRRLTGSGSATVGSLLLSLPLNIPFVMPKTSGNAPTLLLIGPLSNLFVIAVIIWFLHPKKHYYAYLVSSSSDNPRRLWQTINKLLHRKFSSPLPTSISASALADSLASFFTDKISKLFSPWPTVLHQHLLTHFLLQ